MIIRFYFNYGSRNVNALYYDLLPPASVRASGMIVSEA